MICLADNTGEGVPITSSELVPHTASVPAVPDPPHTEPDVDNSESEPPTAPTPSDQPQTESTTIMLTSSRQLSITPIVSASGGQISLSIAVPVTSTSSETG